MILAVDVDYQENTAQVAGLMFEHWSASEPENIYLSTVNHIAAYEAGSFYKRELPCILALLSEHDLKPSIIVIDGYVYLDGFSQAGLGKYLFDELLNQVAIVGVAKRPFKDISEEYAVYRGESKVPLFVTSVGLDAKVAVEAIKQMHGKYRAPTLLKKADQACRGKL